MTAQSGAAAVFFDRDGVLNEIVERDGRPGSPRSLAELRLASDIDAVSRVKQAGYLVFIITNQPDIARGNLSEAEFARMMEVITSRIPVDDFRVCLHEDRHACSCRKPLPGMINQLAQSWGVDTARSYVVGDMWRDVDAARAAGCTAILIRTDYNGGVRPDHTVGSLTGAVDLVLAAGQAGG